jgi:peptidoglycan-associated lipoprotein
MKSKRFVPLLAATSALALLGGCGDSNIVASWTQEAGAFLDEGEFGNPTMNNTQIHSGEKLVLIDLNARFSREVPSTVNFEFNSARLDESAKAVLIHQASWIRQFPEVRFRVYGHTDLVGTDAYNQRLGLRRAQAVVNFLVSQGISRSRLEAMVSHGESQPLIATEERERQNRRTVTEVSGFVTNHPLYLNGKYAQLLYREYVESGTERPIWAVKGPDIINTTETF